MSLLADCTCRKEFGYVFGEYSTGCPRHGSVAKWLKEKAERRTAELLDLRRQALTRPIHGGYPDARCRCGLLPDDCHPECPHGARPGRDWYEEAIIASLQAEDAVGGVLAVGALVQTCADCPTRTTLECPLPHCIHADSAGIAGVQASVPADEMKKATDGPSLP